jgi:hypothetical protein
MADAQPPGERILRYRRTDWVRYDPAPGDCKVISLDNDFAIYRFGPDRRQAFEVVR